MDGAEKSHQADKKQKREKIVSLFCFLFSFLLLGFFIGLFIGVMKVSRCIAEG